jgi:hypothetical protein
MISTYTKDFLGEKNWPKFARFIEFYFFKSSDFYDKFQYVAKILERFCFSLLSHLICSQIWLNYFVNDHNFGNIHKILKRNPGVHSALIRPFPLAHSHSMFYRLGPTKWLWAGSICPHNVWFRWVAISGLLPFTLPVFIFIVEACETISQPFWFWSQIIMLKAQM